MDKTNSYSLLLRNNNNQQIIKIIKDRNLHNNEKLFDLLNFSNNLIKLNENEYELFPSIIDLFNKLNN